MTFAKRFRASAIAIRRPSASFRSTSTITRRQWWPCRVLDLPFEILLPRVFCYFDDVAGGPAYCYNEFTGELLAINEFNESHPDRKLALIAGLRHNFRSLPALWHEQMYVAHLFKHAHYNTPAHAGDQHLALK